MHNKKIILVSCFGLILFASLFFINLVSANDDESPDLVGNYELYTYVEADTYVNDSNPTKNYGTNPNLYLGDYLGNYYEIYLSFSLINKPLNIVNATIQFSTNNIYGTTYNYNVSAYLIEESWNEKGLTYNTIPKKEKLISNTLWNSTSRYEFVIDITDTVEDTDEDSISVCLVCININEMMVFYSQDYFEEEWDDPRIVWNCGYAIVQESTYQLILIIGSIIGPSILIMTYIQKKIKVR